MPREDKPTEFTDTNEAGRKYKNRGRSDDTRSSGGPDRSTDYDTSESDSMSEEDRIRSDLKRYRKNVLRMGMD